MNYDVRLVDVAVQYTAVVRGETTYEALIPKIRSSYDEFFLQIDAVDTGKRGLNVIYYPACDSGQVFPIEVGIHVGGPFSGTSSIICSKIPPGRAAMALHVGPYEELYKAHTAIRRWCTDRGRELEGSSWEIYGHWLRDPSQRSTEVYYRLI